MSNYDEYKTASPPGDAERERRTEHIHNDLMRAMCWLDFASEGLERLGFDKSVETIDELRSELESLKWE